MHIHDPYIHYLISNTIPILYQSKCILILETLCDSKIARRQKCIMGQLYLEKCSEQKRLFLQMQEIKKMSITPINLANYELYNYSQEN